MFADLLIDVLDKKPEKSNAEINKDATLDWANTLRPLWTAAGKPIDKEQYSAYLKALNDVPIGLLEQAVKRILNAHIYANIATIGEIRREVNSILNETQTYSIEEWIEQGWNKCFYRA